MENQSIHSVAGEKIVIRGAREHNLKNISVEIPRNKLVVISGLSGSGKSSLAFDTLFAEGQRRYMESLSSYARQFLGSMDKPDVDSIEGLSPAISIEQKTTHNNPRSTVGTVTEIYDYYRLLFARIGRAHCPNCAREIKEQSEDQIIETILSWGGGTRITLLAPVIRGKKGEHQKIIEDARKSGFVRARIDGLMVELDDSIKLDKQKKHTIEIVVDRIVIKSAEESRKRLAESVEAALQSANGVIVVLRRVDDDSEKGWHEEEVFFSQKNACPDCGISIPELQPRLFSFNNPFGACPECTGIGEKMEWDAGKILPDDSLSFNQGAFPFYNPDSEWNHSMFSAVAETGGFSLDTPVRDLSDSQRDFLWNGDDSKIMRWVYHKQSGEGYSEYKRPWIGIWSDLRRRHSEAWGEAQRVRMEERFMSVSECKGCHGKRLRKEALGVTVGGRNIIELCALSVVESLDFIENLALTETETLIAAQILKEIKARLTFLRNVGLDYLTLERSAGTLSGGEAQRIRLATQIGSGLTGVMYILDEPSIGLHQRDNERLIGTLTYLRDLKNTVIVVEHDEQTLRTADWVVDIGKGAGVHGGNVIASGTPEQVMEVSESVTGQYLSGAIFMPVPEARRVGNGNVISIRGAREHNLRNISVDIPLGTFTCITGVSGSGKSTLLSDVFYPVVSNALMRTSLRAGEHDGVTGIEHIDKVINIDQSPIGRTPRSNPVTYVGVFDSIRELFSTLPDSKARGYKSGRFSFNVRGGRCENCQGAGTITIEMNFLPDVFIQCDVCHGRRFNQETLDVRYKGKSISDVLDMTIEEAADFFSSIPHISRKLETLKGVGLGYIQLGQSALTLSGGEAQRVKLASELARPSTGKTLYILDEPTTGLHFADVKVLMEVIQRLVDKGNSVVMIEHNLDVICQADHIIDLGPDGGNKGGQVVDFGTPEEVAFRWQTTGSYTGKFIEEQLSRARREQAV